MSITLPTDAEMQEWYRQSAADARRLADKAAAAQQRAIEEDWRRAQKQYQAKADEFFLKTAKG